MTVPFERSAIETYASKTAWDAVAAELLGSMLHRWHLSDPEVFPATAAAVVAAVRRQDGSAAVLKIGYPHEEGIWEAVLLDALPPDLAPQMLDQDPWSWAMLLERLDPGTTLLEAALPAAEAVAIGSELHRRLLATPPPSGMPALEAQYRPFVTAMAADAAAAMLRDAGIADGGTAAVRDFDRLCDSTATAAVLHGDLNPANILRHAGGWRLLDPKPAVGDPAFDTFSLVRDLMTDSGEADDLARLTESAAAIAGVDAERALRWIRVRATLSAFWYLEDGLPNGARRDAELALSAERLLPQ